MKVEGFIRLFKKGFLQLCIFFYIYSVQLTGIPFGSRILLAMSGFAILVFTIDKQVKTFKQILIKKELLTYFFLFGLIILVSVLSLILNNTRDYEFVKYPVSLVLIILAAYFIHFIAKKTYRNISYETIMKYILVAVLIQVMLALLSFLFPPFADILNRIQSISEFDISKLEETAEFRLTGFGATFFGAGIVNSYALLIVAVLLSNPGNSNRRIFFLTLSFIMVFVLGMMMARTTIIGLGMAAIYLLTPSLKANRRIIKNKLLFLLNLILLPIAGLYLLFLVSPKLQDTLSSAAAFGFEMFINYSEQGEFSSKSTSVLQTMFIFPDNMKTYLIGDGRYYQVAGDPGSSYYMGTDVGYLRLTYYFGIFGMVCYFILQFAGIESAISKNPGNKPLKKFLLLSFICCLILNVKGFTDFFFLTILFSFCFSPPVNSEAGSFAERKCRTVM
ncbi:hypothetical protein [Foetidibacter luteolus]|uniref:hypothetical protein n=1 Tax=Foetidibacter luteolus TaxID=2608880 RepID=UPI00129B07C8|nr:hypothetical protein [Foetidibacter luteolus]